MQCFAADFYNIYMALDFGLLECHPTSSHSEMLEKFEVCVHLVFYAYLVILGLVIRLLMFVLV